MKVAFFDAHNFERPFFEEENKNSRHELYFFETRLTEKTANLAKGHDCVCAFVNDCLDSSVLKILSGHGVRLIALRSAGYNHIDLKVALDLGLKVVRVPEYSPHAVSEHAVALLLSLNRKIHRSYQRVREGNFSLDGLVGFDLFEKTIGVIGTGRIGVAFTKAMLGFGAKVIAHDPKPSEDLVRAGVTYCELETLFKTADVISLHCPLNPSTKHIVNETAFSLMKKGLLLINTGRGALIDTKALVRSLKSGHLGGAGLDVYEEEEGLFFENLSDEILQDDILARLLTFPNVLMTAHQGFLTKEALTSIAKVTLANISEFESGKVLRNEVMLGS